MVRLIAYRHPDIDSVGRERAAVKLQQLEGSVLSGVTSTSAAGVSLRWMPRPKRDGGILRRWKSGSWGCIEYRGYGDSYREPPLTREQALEIMAWTITTPAAIREQIEDARLIRMCGMCCEEGQGQDALAAWGEIRALQDSRIWRGGDWGEAIAVCADCIAKIRRYRYEGGMR